jgi:hypothetical protein
MYIFAPSSMSSASACDLSSHVEPHTDEAEGGDSEVQEEQKVGGADARMLIGAAL